MRYVAVVRRKTHVVMSRANEAVRVLRGQGIMAAAKFGANVAVGTLRERLIRPKARTNAIDTQYGTDTAGNVKLHGLDIRSQNYQHAIYYRPTDIPILAEILDRLALRHEDYTFIDYGSGKGLVLLQAAAYPFKKVVGVEFARELHEIARHNLERHPARQRRSQVELVHGDAVEFSPPSGNLVLYFYEPFEAPVTRKVIDRVKEFRLTRDVVAACVWSRNPAACCKPLWDAEPVMATVTEGDGWTIYRAR